MELRKAPNERAEREILRQNGGKGSLVQLQSGKSGHGTVLTVHGINGSPETVAPLAANVPKDKAVMSFAYDDGHSRLGDSSQQMADCLRKWSQQHPGEKLEIRAHCMGARMTVDALRKLSEQGGMPKNVKLDLIAPAASGFAMANSAAMVPDPIAKLLPNTAPGKDMGTTSKFQKQLEATHLPAQVKTRIFVGDKDALINPQDARFQTVARNLNAQVRIMKGEDHMSVLGATGKTL